MEIREKLAKGDEKELERQDISRADAEVASEGVEEKSFAKIMRLMDEAIEKEKQEDEMTEKLRTGRIVECQVGSLKFRVQPPSPKVNVKRVKELQPLSELVAAAEKDEESTSSPIVTRSIDSDTFGDIVERSSSVVDPQMSSSKPQNTDRPMSKFKRARMLSRKN